MSPTLPNHVQKICFVCLGNICRSPLAEGVARAYIAEHDLDYDIESAGTGGWHVGKAPDPRMQDTARGFGLDISGLRAAQITAADLNKFDLFVAMDHSNAANLRQTLGTNAPIVMLLEFHDGPEDEVPDPYYGGDAGFQHVYELVSSAVQGLFKELETKRG